MKRNYLLCYLFTWVSLYGPVKAQIMQAGPKGLTIPIKEAPKHVGDFVKLNCEVYKTVDNGKILSIYMPTKSPEKVLMLALSGESRKTILTEMRIRRRLNRQIESPLDTSITATGKIIWSQGRLSLLVNRDSDVYLGADLQIEEPLRIQTIDWLRGY